MMTNNSMKFEGAITRDLPTLAAELAGVRPYPEVVELVRAAASDPRTAASDVARIVEGDVGTATDVLRVANAPASGLAMRCTSVRHAVSLLGLKRVSEVVGSAAALAIVENATAQHPALAAHALAVAGVARLLAPIVAVSPDEAFTLGLLHDVGAMLVVQSNDPFYEGLVEQAPPGEEPSIADERALMGFDHGALGGEVLKKWLVPEPIPQVVTLHHDWDAALEAGGAVAVRVALLRVAGVLVSVLEVTAEPHLDEVVQLFAEPAFAHLGLSPHEVLRMWAGLRKACSKAFSVSSSDGDAEDAAAATATPPPFSGTRRSGAHSGAELAAHAAMDAAPSPSRLAWWLVLGACLVAAIGGFLFKMM